ncbi:hypothetical protein AB0J25_17905 [Streptomyces sp. NPDC049910]|uniref:hypothetical protein n=1 Tax=Streptomyces sp. NPDC049910 TaxID=3155278 RepID=UPI00341A02B5
MGLRRWRSAAVAAVALAATGVLATPGAAHADNGDGLTACNSGEICFWRYSGAVLWTKQFWYTANHGGYTWWAGQSTGVRMQDDAVEITNRDTQCDVRVGNRSPATGLWTWRYFPNDHVRRDLGEIRNANDRHERVC